MCTKQVSVTSTVRVRAYPIIADAVELAVSAGYAKARKWAPPRQRGKPWPPEDLVCDQITEYVLGALCDALDFGDG